MTADKKNRTNGHINGATPITISSSNGRPKSTVPTTTTNKTTMASISKFQRRFLMIVIGLLGVVILGLVYMMIQNQNEPEAATTTVATTHTITASTNMTNKTGGKGSMLNNDTVNAIDKNKNNTLPFHDYAEILQTLNQQGDNLTLKQQLDLFLPLDIQENNNMISLYSKAAQDKFWNLFQKGNNDNIVIVANGGSSTAGGGHVGLENVYHEQFAALLQQHHDEEKQFNITTYNAGHGGRMSYQTTLLAESFLPDVCHVLIWEFSMNDEMLVHLSHQPEEEPWMRKVAMSEERNHILLWLDKILNDYYRDNPPIILVVYFWSVPLKLDGYNRHIISNLYRSHNLLFSQVLDPKQQDLILGHVHLTDYFEKNLIGKDGIWQRGEFYHHLLAYSDDHHPSALGHGLTAHLLYDLVSNRQRKPLPLGDYLPSMLASSRDKKNIRGSKQSMDSEWPFTMPFEWVCNTSRVEKIQQIYDVILSKRVHSKASFTVDEPNILTSTHRALFDQKPQRRLLPQYRALNSTTTTIMDANTSSNSTLLPNTTSEYNWTMTMSGKADSWRRDRMYSLELPLCHEGRIVFSLSSTFSLRAIQFVVRQTLAASARSDKTGPGIKITSLHRRQLFFARMEDVITTAVTPNQFRFYLNDNERTLDIIDASSARCTWSMPFAQKWLILDDNENETIKEISMCQIGDTTSPEKKMSVNLEHLVLF